jgi:hypothetical protein
VLELDVDGSAELDVDAPPVLELDVDGSAELDVDAPVLELDVDGSAELDVDAPPVLDVDAPPVLELDVDAPCVGMTQPKKLNAASVTKIARPARATPSRIAIVHCSSVAMLRSPSLGAGLPRCPR